MMERPNMFDKIIKRPILVTWVTTKRLSHHGGFGTRSEFIEASRLWLTDYQGQLYQEILIN